MWRWRSSSDSDLDGGLRPAAAPGLQIQLVRVPELVQVPDRGAFVGIVKEFTGISDPYEEAQGAGRAIDTSERSS